MSMDSDIFLHNSKAGTKVYQVLRVNISKAESKMGPQQHVLEDNVYESCLLCSYGAC